MTHHSEPLERAVLGAVLFDNNALDKVKDRLSVGDFYLIHHQHVYKAMVTLRNDKKTIDMFTLQGVLGNKLDQMGGVAMLAGLAEELPSAAHIDQYAESVKTMSVRRQLLTECQKVIDDADGEISKVLPVLEQKIAELTAQSVWDSKSEEDIMGDYLDWYAERAKRQKEGYVGIKTGNKWIDKRVVFDRKELVTIAGRPGMGKSAFSLDLAIGMAHNGFSVLFLSLEMDPFKNINRAIANTTRKRFNAVENCLVKDMTEAISEYQSYTKGNLIIRGLRNPTFERVRAVSMGFDVVVIDQLSNVKLPDGASETKPSKITSLCYDLLNMSMDHDQLVVLCSQINRSGDKEPQLIYLKDSGGIEEASLKVIFVHRQRKEQPTTDLICAKNRNGSFGHKVRYIFDWEHMRFRPRSDLTEQEVQTLFRQ